MLTAALLLAMLPNAPSNLVLARGGRALAPILVHSDATLPERHAAEELALHLRQITGAAFEVRQADELPPGPCIVVGPGPMARAACAPSLEGFGAEELLRQCSNGRLLLA
ncbi:MAG TPA: hypothetical protein DER07_06720, partial [Armatimonadetes bacterium]|nr:hypothetical protein [Armatimonadota bacterium]